MLISVWKQTLVDGREERDQVSRAAHEQVSLVRLDFHFEGHKLRALEQNPEIASRWAQMHLTERKSCTFCSKADTL